MGSNGPVRNEPTNDHLPTSIAKIALITAKIIAPLDFSWLERRTGIARSRVQTPLKS